MTRTQPVNLKALEERFEAGAEVTPETLKAKRLIRSTRIDVKVLGVGELSKALTVHAHGVSATAREKIEQAGGTIVLLREPKATKKRSKAKPKAEAAPAEPDAAEPAADEAAEGDA
jgi:large subunit ribosomal protein L15